MTELPLNPKRISKKEKTLLPEKLKYWILTIGLILLLLAITIPLRPYVATMNLILIYSLFVLIISSITPGYFMGFVAAVLCTFLFDFFINPPWNVFEFSIKLPISLMVMLLVTVLSSGITAHMKEVTEKSEMREKQSYFLYGMAQRLMRAKDQKSIINIANQYLAEQLKRSIVFYVGDPGNQDAYCTPYPEDYTMEYFQPIQELRSARHAYDAKEPAGYGTSYYGERNAYYLPFAGNILSGVVGFSSKSGPLRESDKQFIQMVLSQITLALDRQHSQEEQRQSQVESEKEKMRNSLLRAISHDLRTPLTSILAGSETLLNLELDLDSRESKHLVQDIKEETEWLIRVVENLLTITRLVDTNTHIDMTPEIAEEVIGESVRIIRKWYPDWTIHVKAPENPIFVPMDATLISQVLLNLLENAVKHSRPEDLIFVNLKKDENYAIFEVSDNGTGISEELLENLFNSPPSALPRTSDSGSGAGLGLSICYAIVKLHGGVICGDNKATGGATFTFKLPLERRTYESDDSNSGG